MSLIRALDNLKPSSRAVRPLLFLSLAVICWFPIDAWGDEPEIENLIRGLGAPEFAVREESESKLLKLGQQALPALKQAAVDRERKYVDNEIRLRSKRLVILIERVEYEKQVKAFLSGESDQIQLGGWERFKRVAGSELESRQLFIAMHESQRALLESISQTPGTTELKLNEVVRRKLRVSSYSKANSTMGTLAAVLHTAIHELPMANGPKRIELNDYNVGRIKSVLLQSQMTRFIESANKRKQFRRLVLAWLDTLPHETALQTKVKLELIRKYGLSEQLGWVDGVLLDRQQPNSNRILAIQVIDEIANSQQLAGLKQLLDESTLVGKFYLESNSLEEESTQSKTTVIEVHFGDIALATCLRKAKLDLAEFGFPVQVINNDGKLNSNLAGFPNEQVRQRAFEKWRQMQTNQ